MIKNCMEDIVEDLLPLVLEQYQGICTCSRCIDDIKAITLNNLKPLYAASDNGRLYIKINEMKIQFRIDIINELTKAVEKVIINPLH